VIEYREGSSKTYHNTKQQGLTKYSNITLKRGVFKGDFEFFQSWQKTFIFQEATVKYCRNITIKLLDEQHSPILPWELLNAWPCRVKWGELSAMESSVLMEELEITHEGLILRDLP
jgi:phage tail-like protein